MEDIVFHIAVGVKNDVLSKEAGETALAEIIEERVYMTIMDLPWVTDLLISKES